MSRRRGARARLGLAPRWPIVGAGATIDALREHPELNATLERRAPHPPRRAVNLGIAVSLGEDGLIVPVIRDAQELAPRARPAHQGTLGAPARAELTPDDVRGGTFTITNPGQSARSWPRRSSTSRRSRSSTSRRSSSARSWIAGDGSDRSRSADAASSGCRGTTARSTACSPRGSSRRDRRQARAAGGTADRSEPARSSTSASSVSRGARPPAALRGGAAGGRAARRAAAARAPAACTPAAGAAPPGELPCGRRPGTASRASRSSASTAAASVTYHGPGQLVGYPIMRVGDVRRHLARWSTCSSRHSARGRRRPQPPRGRPGLHGRLGRPTARSPRSACTSPAASRPTASRVNVDNDLEPFTWVVACGLPGVHMTSVARETGRTGRLPCFGRETAFRFAAGPRAAPAAR